MPVLGTLLSYDLEKGLGLIRPDNGGEAVVFWARHLRGVTEKNLVHGARVSFELKTWRRKGAPPSASQVVLVADSDDGAQNVAIKQSPRDRFIAPKPSATTLTHQAPNKRLHAELVDVARNATDLEKNLLSNNSIDDRFPKVQTVDIITSLKSLAGGTAIGAFEILQYASRRLPAIRHEYVDLEDIDEKPNVPPNDEAPPPQIRGTELDRLLVNLIGSVATALAECRKQQSNSSDEGEEDVELRLTHDNRDANVRASAAAAYGLARNASSASSEIAAAGVQQTKAADDLQRSLQDISGLGRLAGAELSLRTTVVSWVRSIGVRLRDYPKIIEKSGSAIQLAASSYRVTVAKWEDIKHRILHFVIDEVERAGKELESFGAGSKRADGNGKATSTAESHAPTPDVSADTEPIVSGDAREVERKVRMRLVQARENSATSRLTALKDLVEKHASHPETIWLLLEEASSKSSRSIRHAALSALNDDRIGGSLDVSATSALIARYKREPSTPTSRELLRMLDWMPLSSSIKPVVYEFLFDVFDDDQSDINAEIAMSALVSHFPNDEDVVVSVADTAKEDPNKRLRSKAFNLLLDKCARHKETYELAEWAIARQSDPALRMRAVRAAGRDKQLFKRLSGALENMATGSISKDLRREVSRIFVKHENRQPRVPAKK